MDDSLPSGRRSRRRLPHFDAPGRLQIVTIQLKDALPPEVLARVAAESASPAARMRAIERALDAGHGCCVLGHPEIAAIVRDALRFHDGTLYEIVAWVILPNHVHLILRQIASLPRILQSIKAFTSREIRLRATELGLPLPETGLWQREYRDRLVRGDAHLAQAIRCIHEHPVAAGLARTAAEYPWSSAVPGR